jgi:hypothetical protein
MQVQFKTMLTPELITEHNPELVQFASQSDYFQPNIIQFLTSLPDKLHSQISPPNFLSIFYLNFFSPSSVIAT